MTDLDIYGFGTHVIDMIATDLSDGIYAKSSGTLTVLWVDKPTKLNAEAHSPGDLSRPPQHTVKLWYELARQLYRACEAYHEFAARELLNEPFETIFKDFDPKPRLPGHIDRADSVRNMFIGGLTWVFFHELGHLMQEHGYIRSKFGGGKFVSSIVDCEANGSSDLDPRAAVISHVTEFAADVEAISFCVAELVRHFLPTEEHAADEHFLLEFRSNLYLMMCGISCALYLFAGSRPRDAEPVPEGTHPTPMRRLEICLPNVFERLDYGGQGQKLHGLNRKQLVHLCSGAAYSVGAYWLSPYSKQPGVPNHVMPMGMLQDPYRDSYWSEIVKAWDEILPAVKEARRFGSDFGLLHFTKELRVQLGGAAVT